jgi:hypothetical protein
LHLREECNRGMVKVIFQLQEQNCGDQIKEEEVDEIYNIYVRTDNCTLN